MKYPTILSLQEGDQVTINKKTYEVMKCGDDCLFIPDKNDLQPIDFAELRKIKKSTEKATHDLRYYQNTKEYVLFKIEYKKNEKLGDPSYKRLFIFDKNIEKKDIKIKKIT